MIKYRGFLALLLVLAIGVFYSPHLLPAAGFTDLANQGDVFNDAGRVSEAHQEYLKALPLASERVELIRALGSLAATSYSLGNLQDSRQYIRRLLDLAPNNKWAVDWLAKVEARLAEAAPAPKPAPSVPQTVEPAPAEPPVVAKPAAPETPPVQAASKPEPPAPAKPAPVEPPAVAKPKPVEPPPVAKPAPEPAASPPAARGDTRKLVKDFPNWYRFGPKPKKPAIPYEEKPKPTQPQTTAAVKPDVEPRTAPEPAQLPEPESAPEKPAAAPAPPTPEVKEEEPGLLDTFAKWFGLGPEPPPKPAPEPMPTPTVQPPPKPVPVPETRVARLPEIPGVQWLPHEKGLAVGRREKEDVLIVFSGNNCHWCEKMNADTFGNQSVAKYMTDNFVLVRVNTDQEKDLAKSYRVRGIPTSMFVAADGQQIGPYSGYIPPSSFLAILKSVKSRAYKK